MQQQAGQTSRSLETVDKRLNKVGRTARRVGVALGALFGGIALIATMRDAARTIAGFEETMLTLEGVTRSNTETMAAFEKQARRMGATTKFSASEAGEGLLFLARAGFDAQAAMAALPATLDLAITGMVDLGTAADIASNVVSQFSLSAEDTSRVVDSLTNASNNSNTSLIQLAEAMKLVGPLAGALGMTVEETASAIGVLGDRGIQASLAGTNLRGIISTLLSESSKLKAGLNAMGLTMEDVSLRTNTLSEAFHALGEAGLTAQDALAIFEKRNVTSALTLAASAERMDELTKIQMENIGQSEKQARLMESGLSGAFKTLRSTVEELFLTMGDKGLGKAISTTIKTMTSAIRVLGGFADSSDRSNTAAAVLATSIQFVALAIGTLIVMKVGAWWMAFSGGVSIATAAMRVFNVVVAANPLGLLALALSTVIGIAIVYRNHFNDAEDQQRTFNDELQRSVALMTQFESASIKMSRALELEDKGLEMAVLEQRLRALVQLSEQIREDPQRLVATGALFDSSPDLRPEAAISTLREIDRLGVRSLDASFKILTRSLTEIKKQASESATLFRELGFSFAEGFTLTPQKRGEAEILLNLQREQANLQRLVAESRTNLGFEGSDFAILRQMKELKDRADAAGGGLGAKKVFGELDSNLTLEAVVPGGILLQETEDEIVRITEALKEMRDAQEAAASAPSVKVISEEETKRVLDARGAITEFAIELRLEGEAASMTKTKFENLQRTRQAIGLALKLRTRDSLQLLWIMLQQISATHKLKEAEEARFSNEERIKAQANAVERFTRTMGQHAAMAGLVGDARRDAMLAQQIANIEQQTGIGLTEAEIEVLRRLNAQIKEKEAARRSETDAERERLKLEREKQQETRRQEDALARFDQFLVDLEFEATLIGRTNAEREQAVILRQAEALAMDAQISKWPELRANLLEEIKLRQQRRREEEELERVSRQTSQTIARGVEDVILKFEEWNEVLKNVLLALERLVIRTLVTEPLAEGLSGILKGVLSGFGSGFGSGGGLNIGDPGGPSGPFPGGFGSGSSSASGNLLRSGGGIVPLAQGGIISSPMLIDGKHLAGEAGAEVVIAPLERGTSGKVGINVTGLSQGGNVYNFSFSGVRDFDSFRRSKTQLMNDVTRAVRASEPRRADAGGEGL